VTCEGGGACLALRDASRLSSAGICRWAAAAAAAAVSLATSLALPLGTSLRLRTYDARDRRDSGVSCHGRTTACDECRGRSQSARVGMNAGPAAAVWQGEDMRCTPGNRPRFGSRHSPRERDRAPRAFQLAKIFSRTKRRLATYETGRTMDI
jgi:hypothetical protein